MILLLNPYLDAIIALGLAFIATVLIEAIFHSLSGLPYIGGKIESFGQKVAQTIGSVCGSIASGVTHAIGVSFHAIGAQLDQTWKIMSESTAAIAHIASVVAGHVYSLTGLRALVHDVTKILHTLLHRFVTIGREIYALRQDIRVIERDIAKGIGHDVLPRLRSLERKVSKIGSETIPAIESAEGALANDISALGEYIRANFVSTATDAVTAAVAVGLGALGLGGLRCSNFRNLLGKFGCGLGSLLNDLLGLMIAGIALESVCEFLPLLEDAFGAVAGPMVHLLNEVPLGSCETQPDGWAHLSVSHGPLPPAQTLGPFPV